MRTFQVIMSVISTLLVAFTLICGFWIHNPANTVDGSSVNFHMVLAIAAGVSVLITTVITLIRK
jgi:hypothetical protein